MGTLMLPHLLSMMNEVWPQVRALSLTWDLTCVIHCVTTTEQADWSAARLDRFPNASTPEKLWTPVLEGPLCPSSRLSGRLLGFSWHNEACFSPQDGKTMTSVEWHAGISRSCSRGCWHTCQSSETFLWLWSEVTQRFLHPFSYDLNWLILGKKGLCLKCQLYDCWIQFLHCVLFANNAQQLNHWIDFNSDAFILQTSHGQHFHSAQKIMGNSTTSQVY